MSPETEKKAETSRNQEPTEDQLAALEMILEGASPDNDGLSDDHPLRKAYDDVNQWISMAVLDAADRIIRSYPSRKNRIQVTEKVMDRFLGRENPFFNVNQVETEISRAVGIRYEYKGVEPTPLEEREMTPRMVSELEYPNWVKEAVWQAQ